VYFQNTLFSIQISRLGFIASLTSLVACGGGTTSGTIEEGRGQEAVKFTPLNDTGVTYMITDQLQSIPYVKTKSTTEVPTMLMRPEIILAPTSSQTNFETPWKVTLPGDIVQEGINSEPFVFNNTTEINQLQQDGSNGRDVSFNVTDTDGKAGFHFEKLDRNNGSILPNDETDDSRIGCINDINTNLMWEHKTNSTIPDFHDARHVYSWYNPDNNTNGGDEGQFGGGACAIEGDTKSFIDKVNASKLCGFSDWRLPKIEEMRSLVDYEQPFGNMVDSNFFPNLAAKEHRWTSQTKPSDRASAYGFHFYEGAIQPHSKACQATAVTSFLNGVVLVRNTN